MKKRRETSSLISLYFCLVFQKSTIFILFLGILLTATSLIIIANPFLDNTIYQESFSDIQKSYLTQSIFIIELFNSIILIALIIAININSSSFDFLFLSYISRTKICLSKIITIILIDFLITLINSIVLYAIPLILYDKFTFSTDLLILSCYLFLIFVFESSISLFFSTLIPSIFIPIIVSFISIIVRVLSMNFTKINKYINNYLPIIKIGKKIACEAYISTLIWLFILFLLYICVYSIKDLKN